MSLEQALPDNAHVVCFKLVNFGPNTLAETGRIGAKICEISEKQSSFFIIAENRDSVRASLHELIDRFCDKI